MTASTAKANLFTPVMIAGCVIMLVGFGIRASFGLFQIPIASEFNWPRAEYSMAIAIQNLAWGFGQPIFGAIGEKWGDRAAIVLGIITYAIGLALSAFAITPEGHQLINVIIGFGVAGTGFGVILAMIGRATDEKNRSMALGIATAAGSSGQLFGPPIVAALLPNMGWANVFLVMAVAILAVLLVLPLLRGVHAPKKNELEETLGQILKKAMRDPSYTLIFLGFFSCGFQLAFITAHFPAMVAEMCGPILPTGFLASMGITTTTGLGAIALAVIGLMNIIGSITAGALGQKFTRKYLLSGIYTARTIIAVWFIMTPMTPTTVLVFSAIMGALWLATVPLTSGLVAYIYGLRYMGTLYGIIFLSHQIGGFLGVWLGGALYDRFGGYEVVWWVGIAVGAFSAIVHLPVREQPMLAGPRPA
ncbi:MFS transporter [Paracoccaceae bacterium GXU_MW_L88]